MRIQSSHTWSGSKHIGRDCSKKSIFFFANIIYLYNNFSKPIRIDIKYQIQQVIIYLFTIVKIISYRESQMLKTKCYKEVVLIRLPNIIDKMRSAEIAKNPGGHQLPIDYSVVFFDIFRKYCKIFLNKFRYLLFFKK